MIQLPILLDSSMNESRRIRPVALSISEKLTPLSTATMRLNKSEDIPDRCYMKLFTPNGLSAIYRARIPSRSFNSDNMSLNLEHACCEIGDYIVTYEFPEIKQVIGTIIQKIWTYYKGTKWQMGTVAFNDKVSPPSKYQDVMTSIMDCVKQIPAAVITFDFSTTPWTINIAQRESTVTAEGRLNRNITSAEIIPDDSQLCTRVYYDRLGSSTLQHIDADTLSQYGLVEKVLQGSNYMQSEAQEVAAAYFDRYKRPIYSVTINGQDLSTITGEPLDLMRIGKRYRLTVPDENVVLEETITALTWKDVYNSPNEVTIQLNEENKKLLNYINRSISAADPLPSSATASDTKSSISNTGQEIELKVEQTAQGADTLSSAVKITKDYTQIKTLEGTTSNATTKVSKDNAETRCGTGSAKVANNLSEISIKTTDPNTQTESETGSVKVTDSYAGMKHGTGIANVSNNLSEMAVKTTDPNTQTETEVSSVKATDEYAEMKSGTGSVKTTNTYSEMKSGNGSVKTTNTYSEMSCGSGSVRVGSYCELMTTYGSVSVGNYYAGVEIDGSGNTTITCPAFYLNLNGTNYTATPTSITIDDTTYTVLVLT